MDISKLNNTLLYSNKNVEKLARKLINESANAVLMEMFDDKVILADHTTGQIFEANYSFDGNTFEFSDFDEIALEKSSTSLKEAISDYFDDSNISLTESYEKAVANTSDVFENSLTEALAGKNMDNVVNYTELSGIKESLEELKENKTFKLYTERLEKLPTDSIKMFDWNNTVRVALIDEDVNKTINKSTVLKAKKLRSDVNFRKSIMEAATASLDGDNSLLEDLISENVSLLALNDSDLKELVGMSLVTNKKLMESRNEIFDTIQKIISEDSMLSERRTLFMETADEAGTTALAQKKGTTKVAEAQSNASAKTEEAPEVSEEDTEAIVKALEKAKDLAKDEKLVDKIEKLIDSLNTASDNGETDVSAVKESVELLSL